MSLCGFCGSKINDGKPYDEDHLGYDGCEEEFSKYLINEQELAIGERKKPI